MIVLDYKDRRPIYEQVAERLQELMLLGILEQDEKLPSVRGLAVELSINPNTIQRAYMELERQGYIYSVKGKGSFVADVSAAREARLGELKAEMGDLAARAVQLGVGPENFLKMAETHMERQGRRRD